MSNRRTSPSGFTLVELLVVIAIIGILVGLLLPAVQAAREAARRSQCSNNLKQLALGVLNYESAHKTFPVQKAWTCISNTTPNSKGAGAEEHRSWIVYILPYIEQQALYDQMDFDKSGLDGRPNGGTVDDRGNSVGGTGPSNRSLLQQKLPVVMCPSDASNQELKIGADEASRDQNDKWYSEGIELAQGNYACSVGDHSPELGIEPPHGELWGQAHFTPCRPDAAISSKGVRGVFSRSGWSAKMRQITDGTSNTFMAGECIASITPWQDWGFQAWAITGSPMNYRTDYFEQTPYNWDTHNKAITFRSRHPGGAHFAMCDGSVQFLPETMDFALYQAMSTREGGETGSNAP